MHGFMGHRDGSGCSLSRPTGDWRRDIHLFWLDDTPQQARFQQHGRKNALIGQLASEEEEKRSHSADARCVWTCVWQLGYYLLTIQVAVYGLIFPADPVCRAVRRKLIGGFYPPSIDAGKRFHWVAAGGAWLASLTATVPETSPLTLRSDVTGCEVALMTCRVWFSPVLSLFWRALCVAAVGFIAVRPVFWTMPTAAHRYGSGGGIGFVNHLALWAVFIADSESRRCLPAMRRVLLTLAGRHRGSLIIFTLSVNRPVAQSALRINLIYVVRIAMNALLSVL